MNYNGIPAMSKKDFILHIAPAELQGATIKHYDKKDGTIRVCLVSSVNEEEITLAFPAALRIIDNNAKGAKIASVLESGTEHMTRKIVFTSIENSETPLLEITIPDPDISGFKTAETPTPPIKLKMPSLITITIFLIIPVIIVGLLSESPAIFPAFTAWLITLTAFANYYIVLGQPETPEPVWTLFAVIAVLQIFLIIFCVIFTITNLNYGHNGVY